MLLKRIPKAPKRTERWKSQAHLSHVRSFACVNCGGVNAAKSESAHVRMGSDAGTGRKPSDYWAVPLCGGPQGCHAHQHTIGERAFWEGYQKRTGHTVDDVLIELIRTSPRRREIDEHRSTREGGDSLTSARPRG